MVKKFIYPKCEIFPRCFKDKFPLEQKNLMVNRSLFRRKMFSLESIQSTYLNSI